MQSPSRPLLALALLLVASCGTADPPSGGGIGVPDMAGVNACKSHCTAPSQCCGAQCIDLTTDVKNCGQCGKACGAGNVCIAGACKNPSQTCTSCAGICCSGVCIDSMTDGMNCGVCGHTCGGGNTCVGGECMTAGSGCQGCAQPKTCCGGTKCVELLTDNDNCGGCGIVCDVAGGQSCQGGTCKSGKPSGDGGMSGQCMCSHPCMIGACTFGCCLEDLLQGTCSPDPNCIMGGLPG